MAMQPEVRPQDPTLTLDEPTRITGAHQHLDERSHQESGQDARACRVGRPWSPNPWLIQRVRSQSAPTTRRARNVTMRL